MNLHRAEVFGLEGERKYKAGNKEGKEKVNKKK